MNCRNFRELIDSYLCDELLTETNHEVLRHLEMCADCRREIETRRNLRERLKFAVTSASQFQIGGEFSFRLRNQLKQTALSAPQPNKIFWINRYWTAIAACLIFAAGFGFWFLQNQSNKISSTETAALNQKAETISLEKTALGDHQNCAVNYNLSEEPVDIDLQSAEYADLRRSILQPLENAAEKYELVESHVCKYQGTPFTHVVFRHQGKLVSVLLTDLPDNKAILTTGDIGEMSEGEYYLAHFNANNREIFVASNLPEKENMATAEILASSMKKQFSTGERAAFNISLKY